VGCKVKDLNLTPHKVKDLVGAPPRGTGSPTILKEESFTCARIRGPKASKPQGTSDVACNQHRVQTVLLVIRVQANTRKEKRP
jgi:hypothetical protein